MSDPTELVELNLDTITRTVRVAAAAAPKVVTRVGLGVVLAADDVANDPAAELLSIKVTDAVTSVCSTVAWVAGASANAIGSTAQSVNAKVSGSLAKVSSPEAKAARAARFERIPGVMGARAFASKAASEIRETWEAAGTLTVEVATDPNSTCNQVDVEDSASASDPTVAI